MKKFITLLIISVTIIFQANNAYAYEDQIEHYTQIIQNLNDEYGTHLSIMSENQYNVSDYKADFKKSYNGYINDILSMDEQEFRNNCLILINSTLNMKSINVNIDNYYSTFSTQSSKTIYFNNNCNKMTLTYKYIGSATSRKFDTSYKPTASVSVVKTTPTYFRMSTYTGAFLNSDTSYRITAKGNIYSPTGLVSSGATFNVTFNI